MKKRRCMMSLLLATVLSVTAVPVDARAAERFGELSTEQASDEGFQESVSSEKQKNADDLTAEGNIASGELKDDGRDITWVIDKDGKLTVTGTGYSCSVFFEDGDQIRSPWYPYAESILTAEITVTGMTDASFLFFDCSNMKSVNLEGLDTNQITSMSGMFCYCSNLENLDLSKFNTSRVTDMGSMFAGCVNLKNLDLSKFNTSQVTSMDNMFYSCHNLENLDLRSFDTSRVTNMFWMFGNCRSLKNLDLSKFDTSQVTDMDMMFYDCSSLENLDLGSFDTSKVQSMASMFISCSNLKNLDLSKFDTSQVRDMSQMFMGCSNLKNLDLSKFDTSQVREMYGMFSNCSNLGNLDLSDFNTSQVWDMSDMFYGCSNLENLDLSKFDTSWVESMNGMFMNCGSLKNLDLSKFDTSQVTDMRRMFYSCSNLENLDLRGFDTSQVTDMRDMFAGCSSLKKIQTPRNIKGNIALPCPETNIWINPDGTVITELPRNLSESIELRAIRVEGIDSLTADSGTADVGDTVVLTAIVDGDNLVAENGNNGTLTWVFPDFVTWTSSPETKLESEEIITAKEHGSHTRYTVTKKATMEKVGTAKITLKIGNMATNECSIVVNAKAVAVTGVTVSPTTALLEVGETQQLTASVLPKEAANQKVTWSSSDASIVSVDASGLVTARKAGKATITVTTEEGKKTATCAVEVKEKTPETVVVTGISLNKTALKLTVGAKETLTATISPSDASQKDVTWKSSDKKVATVDANGKVKAVAVGKATITVTAKDGGKKATCTITVKLGKSQKTAGGEKVKVNGSGTVVYSAPKSQKSTNITIPATVKVGGKTYKVTSIEAGAFKNNKKLKTVTIGKNVTEIGKEAFKGCTSLTKVTMDSKVKSIGADAFSGCKKLKTVKMSKNVTEIGKNAFKGCKAMTSITIGKGVTEIKESAFNGCSGLKLITIESTKLKTVGKNAFKGINKNAKIKVPSKKLSAYKKLLKGKGQASTVKITK